MRIPRVVTTDQSFKGAIITVEVDTLSLGGGEAFTREVAVSADAVAIVAIDEQERVLLIKQYRHPVKKAVWEIPAGKIDVEGENPEQTALRELREETDLAASHIEQLTVFANSVGWATEKTSVFLAQGLSAVREYKRQDEEADIEKAWVPLSEALNMVYDGTIYDAKTIIGVLLAQARVQA